MKKSQSQSKFAESVAGVLTKEHPEYANDCSTVITAFNRAVEALEHLAMTSIVDKNEFVEVPEATPPKKEKPFIPVFAPLPILMTLNDVLRDMEGFVDECVVWSAGNTGKKKKVMEVAKSALDLLDKAAVIGQAYEKESKVVFR